jgi:hypothetical protein
MFQHRLKQRAMFSTSPILSAEESDSNSTCERSIEMNAIGILAKAVLKSHKTNSERHRWNEIVPELKTA